MIGASLRARTAVAVIALRVHAAIAGKAGTVTEDLARGASRIHASVSGHIANLAARTVIRIIASMRRIRSAYA